MTWNDINELIQQNPILQFAAEQIKSLGIEWLHSIYQKGKARTVDEELALCLEYALESFSKRFALEYVIIPEDFEPPVRILRATIPGIESQSKFRILLLVDYLPRHYL